MKGGLNMKNANRTGRRKLSAGTVFMLVMMGIVLCGSAIVLGRLSSGASVDLSKLNMNVLDIREDPSRGTDETTEDDYPERTAQPSAKTTAVPAAAEQTTAAQNSSDSFTLTFGGTISLSGEVRKNSRSTDAKVADYADVMMLLKTNIRSDVNGVFLENILSDQHKTNDITAPGQAALLLKEAGFNMAACGFSQSYANGKSGIENTLITLADRGVSTLGIRYADDPGTPEIKTIKGIRTAFLQYTSTIPAKTRKTMAKDGTDAMVPEADLSLITQDIDRARQQGAEAVIILLNWGKNGKDPDKEQKELAAGIAAAGADLIIGNGSHVPQTAVYLPGQNGRSVLCAWSLGTLVGGDRTNVRHMSGYMLSVTIRRDDQGGIQVLNPEYIPVYTWKYKQDGRFYYRCIASDREAPDGMDSEQRKMMTKSAETVSAVMKDSPVSIRGQADDT